MSQARPLEPSTRPGRTRRAHHVEVPPDGSFLSGTASPPTKSVLEGEDPPELALKRLWPLLVNGCALKAPSLKLLRELRAVLAEGSPPPEPSRLSGNGAPFARAFGLRHSFADGGADLMRNQPARMQVDAKERTLLLDLRAAQVRGDTERLDLFGHASNERLPAVAGKAVAHTRLARVAVSLAIERREVTDEGVVEVGAHDEPGIDVGSGLTIQTIAAWKDDGDARLRDVPAAPPRSRWQVPPLEQTVSGAIVDVSLTGADSRGRKPILWYAD